MSSDPQRMTLFSALSSGLNPYFHDFDRSFHKKLKIFGKFNLPINFVIAPQIQIWSGWHFFALFGVLESLFKLFWPEIFPNDHNFTSNPNFHSIFCHPIPKRKFEGGWHFFALSRFWSHILTILSGVFSQKPKFSGKFNVHINFIIVAFMEVWGRCHFLRFIQCFRATFPRFRQISSLKASFTAPFLSYL
jgi:hypothetical protein